MVRHKGVFEEKTVGCVLASGCLLTVVTLGLMWMFGMAGTLHAARTRNPATDEFTSAGDLNLLPITFLFFVLGVLLIAGAVGYGLWRNSKDHVGARRVEPYIKILARYVYDKGQLLTADWDIEMADKPRYYVRVMDQRGVIEELETSLEIYYQAGEGMHGEAEIQGRWMGRFVPYIGVPPSS